MKNSKNSFKSNKIHFIGCGGVSMSGLIKHLLEKNFDLSGSDLLENSFTSELKDLGVKVHIGHASENVKHAECVVYTHAVSDENPELVNARKNKTFVLRRSQLLGRIIKEHKKSVCVSGSHGKTTATAMIANALILAKQNPTVFLGGEDYTFGNYRGGDGSLVVAEACEYKKSFLDMKGDISVVLNVDEDHLDFYKDIREIEHSFTEFVGDSIAVINADDNRASKIFNSTTITFGIEKIATYMAKEIKDNQSFYSFTAYAFGKRLGRINLSVLGRHNVYNALATIAVCDILKIPFGQVKKAIENFKGVKRRNEYLGEYLNKPCYADYAHHPREIQSTLSAMNNTLNNYITVFQPHTYSRTESLMCDFVKVFKERSPLIIVKTYSAREAYSKDGSALTLYNNIKEAGNASVYYAKDQSELEELLNKNVDKKTQRILFLGAGDIYEKAKNILVQKNGKKM